MADVVAIAVAAGVVVDALDEVADVIPAGVAALAAVAGAVAVIAVAAALVAAAPALVALGVDLSEPPPHAASSITPTSSIASFFTVIPSIAPTIPLIPDVGVGRHPTTAASRLPYGVPPSTRQ
jgi:hypothetical protein